MARQLVGPPGQPCSGTHAIAAEGTTNQEQLVVADVDLDLLDEQRVNGSVIPVQNLINDAYDNAVHYSDFKSHKRVESGPGPPQPVSAAEAYTL
jgi:hypothetical protein